MLRRSDILISDFSGVIFDFSLVYDKPVIYTDTDFDDAPYDAWWLDTPYWTFDVLPRIGQKLTEENMPRLRELIELPVSAIATDKLVAIEAGSSLEEVCNLLATRRLKKVPVVRDGAIVGTVNRSDVLRYAMDTCLQGV